MLHLTALPPQVLAQNAGAMLGYHACKSEEYRDAIAAQEENIIVPCVTHLQSGAVSRRPQHYPP